MQTLDFMQNISQESKNILLKKAKTIKIKKGSILFYQGDICKTIVFLTKGRVRVVRQNENGQSILLYYFSEGEQCNVNFTNLDNSAPAVGTAIAESDLEGFEIPAPIVAGLFIQDSVFQNYVFKQYICRLEAMASMIEDVRFLSLDTRLLHFLQSQESKVLNFSHEELGDIIGTSREVISRILKSFEKNNILKLSRKKIQLL